jgi:aldehyde dehydrogenase (NAD+)
MSSSISQVEEIKDDPKVVDVAFNKAKRAFATRKSIPYDFRVRQL